MRLRVIKDCLCTAAWLFAAEKKEVFAAEAAAGSSQ
jgi:hypothetical protein